MVGDQDMSRAVDMAGCTCSGATPICVAMTCVSCLSTSDPNGACAAAAPSTPFCATDGARVGSCVGCRDASDCPSTMPFCDADGRVCRGCVSDLECPSLVCDLVPGSTSQGTCIPGTQVEYVDGSAAANGNGLTPTSPRQKIQDAINHATGGDNRKYVRVAPGTYTEGIGVSNGATISVVGADGTTIQVPGGDAVGASTGGSITIRNITAIAANGNAGNCQNGSFMAYRSRLLNSSQSGVYALNCGLVVDACWIDGNMAGGLYVAGGGFRVVNSIITHNTNNGGIYQVANAPNVVVVNDTVADNTATAAVAGISCAAAGSIVVRNTILFNNKGNNASSIAETNCMFELSASDDVSGAAPTVDLTKTAPGFKGGSNSPDAYHLAAGSACIDRASSLSAPDHDFDFERRPDPVSMLPDIGADEVQ